MNILITQDKNVQFLFKIYYLIFLVITVSVLTSLIFTNSVYHKITTAKTRHPIFMKKTIQFLIPVIYKQ